MELDNLIPFLVRWIHLFAGVVWIGILYYFNFVQTEYFKSQTRRRKPRRYQSYSLMHSNGFAMAH